MTAQQVRLERSEIVRQAVAGHQELNIEAVEERTK